MRRNRILLRLLSGLNKLTRRGVETWGKAFPRLTWINSYPALPSKQSNDAANSLMVSSWRVFFRFEFWSAFLYNSFSNGATFDILQDFVNNTANFMDSSRCISKMSKWSASFVHYCEVFINARCFLYSVVNSSGWIRVFWISIGFFDVRILGSRCVVSKWTPSLSMSSSSTFEFVKLCKSSWLCRFHFFKFIFTLELKMNLVIWQ